GNGTSFASPIIAGMAASLWQSVPEATAMEIKNAIVRSAHLYHAPNESMGYGIPDFALARQLLVAEAGSAGELAQGRLVIYPNPYADGFLHLRVNGSCGSEAEMELYDTGGKSVYSARIPLFDGEWRGEQALRVAPGAYVMRLRCPSGQVYRTTLIRSSRR
ncbi:MAG TPA: S8 family peptidase, partial [Cryomorphaceae bacterium]|nr:S8 family peptidase [Cryomorphaceae bacterium]